MKLGLPFPPDDEAAVGLEVRHGLLHPPAVPSKPLGRLDAAAGDAGSHAPLAARVPAEAVVVGLVGVELGGASPGPSSGSGHEGHRAQERPRQLGVVPVRARGAGRRAARPCDPRSGGASCPGALGPPGSARPRRPPFLRGRSWIPGSRGSSRARPSGRGSPGGSAAGPPRPWPPATRAGASSTSRRSARAPGEPGPTAVPCPARRECPQDTPGRPPRGGRPWSRPRAAAAKGQGVATAN